MPYYKWTGKPPDLSMAEEILKDYPNFIGGEGITEKGKLPEKECIKNTSTLDSIVNASDFMLLKELKSRGYSGKLTKSFEI